VAARLGGGSRKRTCDWLGGHAGAYLLQHSAKKRIFVIAITSLAQTAALISHSSGTACAVLTFDSSSRTQPRQRGASLRS
jgi:hypothetical protein